MCLCICLLTYSCANTLVKATMCIHVCMGRQQSLMWNVFCCVLLTLRSRGFRICLTLLTQCLALFVVVINTGDLNYFSHPYMANITNWTISPVLNTYISKKNRHLCLFAWDVWADNDISANRNYCLSTVSGPDMLHLSLHSMCIT